MFHSDRKKFPFSGEWTFLPEPEGATKQARIQALADAYAATLESVVRQYPDQWYNFYDFWK